MKRFISALIAFAMIISMVPAVFASESTTALTSGNYVMVTSTGYAMGTVDGTWILAEAVTDGDISGISAWTITVAEDGTATLCDANGVYVAPKGGNNNGIATSEYSWSVVANEDGTYSFYGQGSDTVVLASNTGSDNKFRGYKTTTVSGYPDSYPSSFTLYAVGGETEGTEAPSVEETEAPCTHESITDYLCDECGELIAPEADSVLSISEAILLGSAHSHNTYTSNKYYVTGVITNVYNGTYGNMYIADEAGNTLTIYGTYSADGSTRYDALETKPVAGDTITVYGAIGQYNSTAQMKNGWITEHVASEVVCEHESVTDYLCDDCSTVIAPAADSTLSIPEATTLGLAHVSSGYTTDKYYVTGVITEVYNTTYGNMYITDDAGNTLCIYGTYDADGTNRYDAMTTQPVAGDTVTVYGVIGQYNGTAQMKNGWIVEHTVVEPEDTTLDLGDNSVSLEAGDLDGETWTYTATEDGNLTITVTYVAYDWMGEGEYSEATGSDLAMGFPRMYSLNVNGTEAYSVTYSLNVVAGDVVTIILSSYNYYATNATLNLAMGEAVEVEPAEPGTVDNPIVIESLPYEISVDGDHDVYYTYTATENVTLLITHPAGNYVSVDGWEDGPSENTKLVSVSAGETVVINPWGNNSGSYTIEVYVEEESTDPISGSGTYSDPYVITVPDAYVVEKTGSIYWTYTATVSGKLTFTMDCDNWNYFNVKNNVSGVNSGYLYPDDATSYTIEMYEGDTVTGYLYTTTNNGETTSAFTLSFEACEVDKTVSVNASSYYLPYSVTVNAGSRVNCQVTYTTASSSLYLTGTGVYSVEIDGETYTSDENGYLALPLVPGSYGTVYTVYLINEGDEAVTVTYNLAWDLGHSKNPEVLTELGKVSANVPEGYSGYYYTWTAPESGKLTFTVLDETNWYYNIENTNTGVGYYYPSWNADWTEQLYVTTVTLDVNEGDVVSINVSHEDYTAGELQFSLSFEAGAVEKFYNLYASAETQDVTDEVAPGASIRYDVTSYLEGGQLTVTGENFYVVVGGTGVYSAELGAFLPEDGTIYEPDDNGVVYLNLVDYATTTIHIVNTGSEAATYTFGSNYPIGTQANPDVLEKAATVTLAENANDYYYTYTATGDGYIIVTVQCDGGVFHNVWNATSYIYGEYTNVEDAYYGAKTSLPVYNGDLVYIQINTWDTDDSIPGGDITVSVEFVEATITGSIVGYMLPSELELPAAGSAVYMLESFWSGNPSFSGENFYVVINGEKVEPDENGTVIVPSGVSIIEIVNTSEEANVITADVYYAPGSYDNPEDLTMGEHSVSVPMYEYYWFAYTATEDGTLTLNMTCDDWYFCEYNLWIYPEYASEYGDSAAVYDVTAGDTLLLRVSTVYGNAGTISFTASFEAASAGDDGEKEYLETEDMLVLGDNFVQTADDGAGEWYYYVEETGLLTVSVAELLCYVEDEGWVNLSMNALNTGSVSVYVNDDKVAYSLDSETAVLTLDVTAGDLVIITVSSATGVALRSTLNLAWESNVHDASDFVLVLGNNGFTVVSGTTTAWTFTAEEAGHLLVQLLGVSYLSEDMFGDMVTNSFQPAELLTLFDGGYVNLTVNGEAFVVDYENGEDLYIADLNLNADDVVVLSFTNNFWVDLDMVVNVSMTEAEVGPTVITELPAELTASFADDNAAFTGLYWNYTAAEAGLICVAGLTEGAYVDVFVNGLYVTTVTGEGTVDVAAGDLVEICLYADVAGDYSCTAMFEAASAIEDYLDCSGWWTAHTSGVEITEEGIVITFNATSYETATENWHGPLYILYTGDEGVVNCTNYSEYWVQRIDNYGWNATTNRWSGDEALAAAGITYTADETNADWVNFLTNLKAGINVTITAQLVDGAVVVTMDGNGVVSTLTAVVDTSKPVYLSLTGEMCTLTDIAVAPMETEPVDPPVDPEPADPNVIYTGDTAVGSGWVQVFEVYTTIWGGIFDTAVMTEGGSVVVNLTADPAESMWSAHLALNGDNGWFQIDKTVETFIVNEDGSYCAIFSYDELVAAYGSSDLSTIGAFNLFVNSDEGCSVTVTSAVYVPAEEEPIEPVTIVTQPESVTVANGEKATVTVEATGDGLTYEWYYRNGDTGEFKLTTSFTGNSYYITMNASRSGRQVYCVVTDVYGNTAVSDVVTLSMLPGVEIVTQPESVTVANGEKATVTVEATGDGLTYAWWYSDDNGESFKITTAFTGNTYSLKMTDARDGRLIYCVITDAYGNSVTTNTVSLNMVAVVGVEITKEPESVTVANGEKATVTVEATGDGLTYAWWYSDDNGESFKITTAFTGNTYSLKMTDARDGRLIYCVITDQYGNSVITKTVSLNMVVAAGVEIVTQPESITVANGEKATVTVEATGDGLTYAWYYSDNGGKSFKKTSAFTGNTYSLTMNESRAGRMLYCVITDAYGNEVQSETVMIGMTGCLKIVGQPEDDAAASGKRVFATVVATGEGLTYTWYYSDDNGKTFKATDAFDGDTYSIAMNAKRDGRQIYCVITDASGNEVVSDVVTLSMN